MSKMIRQTTFSSGQVDIVTWKRTDTEEYLSAAQSLLNCEIGTTGLAKKRKGTTFQYNVTDEAVFNSTMYEFIDKNGVYYLILGASGSFYVFSVPSNESEIITYQDLFVVTYTGTQVVAATPNISLVQSISTPYAGSDLVQLDYTQDNDSLILTSPNYPPGRIYISNYDPLTFSFEYINIYPLPAYDFSLINYNATIVSLSGTGLSGSTLTITFMNMPFGVGIPVFTNAWMGGQIIGGGISEFSPIGYAIIQTVSQSTTTVIFTALVQLPFDVSTPSTVGSQYSIRQPAWVNYDSMQGLDPYGLGYPAKVVYFQNRLWFANTRLLPIAVFGSKLNQPISFDVGTALDTDAIIYTIGQTGTGQILWMNAGKQLEIYTSNYEFACPQNEGSGLTPSTFSVRQQSSYGASSELKPQTYLNDSYFVQKTGKSLINFHFEGVGLTYVATNITPQSQHLMKAPINRALLRGTDTSQDNFIYFLNDSDDTLTTFQFATEKKLSALTPGDFQDNVELIDIVTVNNDIFILKYYDLTEQFTIERIERGTYVDSAEEYYLDNTGIVTGLDRFDGYMVQVVYQNQDYGQYLVENGQITVIDTLDMYGTVQIGLLYDVEIKPMYPFFSATSAPFEKKLSRIYVDYFDSLNFYINGKLVKYQNFHEIQIGLPLVPKTGTEIFSPVSGYHRFDDFAIVITQSSPFNLEILSIGYQIDSAVI